MGTHTLTHTLTHLTRDMASAVWELGMRHWAPNELVHRKLHYLSLAAADKARCEATRCSDCSGTALQLLPPPAPSTMLLSCCPGKSSLDHFKMALAISVCDTVLSHMRVSKCSPSHSNFSAPFPPTERQGRGQECRECLLLLWQLLRLLLLGLLLLLLLVLHFNCSAWCAARAINPAQVVH